jgi:hypothetical protein
VFHVKKKLAWSPVASRLLLLFGSCWWDQKPTTPPSRLGSCWWDQKPSPLAVVGWPAACRSASRQRKLANGHWCGVVLAWLLPRARGPLVSCAPTTMCGLGSRCARGTRAPSNSPMPRPALRCGQAGAEGVFGLLSIPRFSAPLHVF